jgi:hypothetical protein
MTRRFWAEWEMTFLRAHYATERTEHLAQVLGYSQARVLRKANAMGLRKSIDLIAQIARDRTGADHASVAYRWQPGQKPWNTGIKDSTGHHPNTRATQFKPGSKPHTWVPVGSFRIRDNMLEIKFSDARGAPHNRWRPYATHVWVLANGQVAPGHLVVFRPGTQSNVAAEITLDKLECITRAENMARNSMHRLPPELARIHQLRGVLTRAINSKRKEKQTP